MTAPEIPSYPASTLAKLFNLTERRIHQLARNGVIPKGKKGKYELIGSVRGYVTFLQDNAKGRITEGGLNLASERAGLAREQRLLTELKRLQVEKEVAPISIMTLAIAKISAQIAATLEGVPGKIKRTCDGIPAAVLRVVEVEISKARNLAADITIEIDDPSDDGTGNPQSDSGRPEAA